MATNSQIAFCDPIQLLDLPEEILENLLLQVNTIDLKSLMLSCKKMMNLVSVSKKLMSKFSLNVSSTSTDVLQNVICRRRYYEINLVFDQNGSNHHSQILEIYGSELYSLKLTGYIERGLLCSMIKNCPKLEKLSLTYSHQLLKIDSRDTSTISHSNLKALCFTGSPCLNLNMFKFCCIQKLEILDCNERSLRFPLANVWKLQVFHNKNKVRESANFNAFLLNQKETIQDLSILSEHSAAVVSIMSKLNRLQKLDVVFFRRLPSKTYFEELLYEEINETLKELAISIDRRFVLSNMDVIFYILLHYSSSLERLKLNFVDNGKTFNIDLLQQLKLPNLKFLHVLKADNFFLNYVQFDNLKKVYIDNFKSFDSVNLAIIPSVQKLTVDASSVGIDKIVLFYPRLENLRVNNISPEIITSKTLRQTMIYAKNLKILEVPKEALAYKQWPKECDKLKIKIID